jgi:hypothetical protein
VIKANQFEMFNQVLAAENDLVLRRFPPDEVTLSTLRRGKSPSIMKGRQFFPNDFFTSRNRSIKPDQ